MEALPLTLPSGLAVRVRASGGGSPLGDDVFEGQATFGGRFLNALEGKRVSIERREGEAWVPLLFAEVLDLLLPDFHALRDAAYRVRAISHEPEELRCRNCDGLVEDRPEAAPVADLDHWYETDVRPPEGPFPLPLARRDRAPRGGSGEGSTVALAPVTAAQALPLWRELAAAQDPPPPLGEEVVCGLGIRSLGKISDPVRIAARLDDAPEETWAIIETAFLALNYSPQAYFPRVCTRCGTVHDAEAPSAREFVPDPAAERAIWGDDDPEAESAEEPFPDLEAFEALAERLREEIYRERGVRNVAFVVDPGVPAVDGSGEPLLGSYLPVAEMDAAGYTDHRFAITLYYETFARSHRDDPYDVEAEVAETIDHEVQHHLYHLAGHDPMDEAEREEALGDLKRTFGERTVRRARIADVLVETRRLGIFVLLVALGMGALIAFLHLVGAL